MEIISTKNMRLLDQIAINEYKIPSIQLMNQAASCMKSYIDEHFKKDHKIVILCGPGNNGGDGFALALQLLKDQYQHVTIICNVPIEKMSHDCAYYAKKVRKQGFHFLDTLDQQVIKKHVEKQDIVIDALFGTGCSRKLTGYYKDLIDIVNASSSFVLSVDMASGIHSDSGEVMGCAIQSDVTITFECAKYGQFIYPGSLYGGKLCIKPIGIPRDALSSMEYTTIIEHEVASRLLPKRAEHSHKGTYGKVLLIGGSVSMHGAITLCAKSMLKSGVGLLTLFVPHEIVSILSYKLEESMILDAPSKQGFFDTGALALLKETMKDYDLLVIGNGMGRHEVGEELVKLVLASAIPCVIDGDGIFECAKHMELLKNRQASVLLTPHPKEMSYLTNKSIQQILQNPFQVAKDFTQEYKRVTLVLKDQYTLLRDGNDVYLNNIGNNALAKGGSGDVLCGIISGLFAQSKDALSAAVTGVYVHAKCADMLLKVEDANSILPSDLIHMISKVYKQLR